MDANFFLIGVGPQRSNQIHLGRLDIRESGGPEFWRSSLFPPGRNRKHYRFVIGIQEESRWAQDTRFIARKGVPMRKKKVMVVVLGVVFLSLGAIVCQKLETGRSVPFPAVFPAPKVLEPISL